MSAPPAEGWGIGCDDCLFGVLRGLDAIAPVARRIGLHVWLAGVDCASPIAAPVSFPVSGALEALRRSRMSGFDRARLAFVGDAKDGLRCRGGRLAGEFKVGGASESPTGTLVVGDVFLRFGAESIEYF